MMPRASAASVPGISARCSWHFSAVWLRYGSIAISFAPRRLASCTRLHRCRFETTGFEPQIRISLGVFELLEVGADRCADRRGIACLAGGRADRAIEQRRAELVKKTPVHRAALQQSHRAGIAVGQDRLRAIGRVGDRLEARSDRVERFVPAYALEAAFALGADSAQRMQHAFFGIGPLQISGDLGAQHAARRRMIGIAFDLDRAPVGYRHVQRAGVGAIVRACAADDRVSGRLFG